MSSLIVEVCKIDEIKKHPNADALEIAVIKGWESCVPKGKHKQGEHVVFFPPDSILPQELSDKMNITKYLSKGRVLCANLRGVKSFGTVMSLSVVPDLQSLEVGTDVASRLGITKYEAPVKVSAGDAESDNPIFHTYYDMENIKNYTNVFQEGEMVYITEKIHGMSCRLGLIREPNQDGYLVYNWAAGSSGVRRKQFNERGQESVFWKCFNRKIRIMMISLAIPSDNIWDQTNVIVFGELFGSGIQDLQYGMKSGEVDFLAFDISVNGKYIDADQKYKIFKEYDIKHVPILYSGPFSKEIIKEHTDGKSTLYQGQIREGCVIVSAKEQPVETKNKFMTRKQLKSISFDYLNRKGGTEYK